MGTWTPSHVTKYPSIQVKVIDQIGRIAEIGGITKVKNYN
jgi:hypothetical protein